MFGYFEEGMMAPETEAELHLRLTKLDRRNLALAWAIMAWLAGAIFWAGSSYNKFQSMDVHLQQIDSKLSVTEDVKMIRQREEDLFRRVEVLEEQDFQRRIQVK